MSDAKVYFCRYKGCDSVSVAIVNGGALIDVPTAPSVSLSRADALDLAAHLSQLANVAVKRQLADSARAWCVANPGREVTRCESKTRYMWDCVYHQWMRTDAAGKRTISVGPDGGEYLPSIGDWNDE